MKGSSLVRVLQMGMVVWCIGVAWNSVPIGCEECKRKAVIFNFGDSNSDTGGLAAGLGYNITLPNGRTFFRRSTGRLSDGRLVLDVLCQSLNISLLSPYMDSLGSDFTNGANFAIVGSSTLPKSIPFALDIQVRQFLHFKDHSLQITSPPQGCSSSLVDDKGFLNALYMIDIGQNDLSDSFTKNLTYEQVIQRIPSILAQIKSAVKTIYDQGGKNFWIHNTGPLGCLPQKLSLVSKTIEDLDRYGCIRSYNDAAEEFNRGLRALCEEMRTEMLNATIVYVDMYSIKYDIIANSTKYGFENPLMACCGYGGPPYNYDIRLTCGQSGCRVCNEGTRFVSWDGTHYTEAANTMIASKILSTAYSTPQFKFDFFCQA
ncbi:GDSL esterase/lipase At1g09390-like [Telopea speciosissima]|uniref:GDSL esterase/lipase At1g09390-like n=1 Tax=Telopea speciosissima TaxID=54955 RepID=UPI001CC43D74|nr:GDSL esterase/lipase At1g09390-like [Telopea speciosissima]